MDYNISFYFKALGKNQALEFENLAISGREILLIHWIVDGESIYMKQTQIIFLYL